MRRTPQEAYRWIIAWAQVSAIGQSLAESEC